MSMISDINARVMKDPINVLYAMAAGVFAPRFLGGVAVGAAVPIELVSPIAGAVSYYMMSDVQDTTSMIIGGAAGYAGPMIAARVAPQLMGL